MLKKFNIKFTLIALLSTSLFSADDIQRLESIVKDITELRVDYEECKSELQSKQLPKKANSSTCQAKVLKLEKELKNQKIILLAKEKELSSLKNQLQQDAVKPILVAKTCEEINIFPKLMMREETQELNSKSEVLVSFEPSTFRVKITTAIYDSPDGVKIDEWEMNSSFTSTQKINNWIKITGYFVDKKWQKATRDMWLKEEDVFKR